MSVRVLSLMVLVLTLSGCASNPFEVTISRCPAVAIVGDAGTVTRFQGEGRTVEDVLYTASISDLTVSCDESDSITSAVNFYIGAQSDGKVVNETVNLQYFVVVLKDNSQIVTKRVYDVALNFDENGFADSLETIAQFIPTVEQARRYNYELLVGFQFDVNDAVFNMER